MDKIKTYQTINILILALLIAYLIKHHNIFLLLAILLLINNLIFFQINELIANLWIKFGEKLGNINSKVMLTIIFYFFLSPIGYLYRLFNKTKVIYFTKDIKNSYFENIKESYDKDYFTKQW